MDKRNIVKFSSKHYHDKTFLNNYQNNSIKESTSTKCLALELDEHINWKNFINKILPQLSSACVVVRSMYSNSNMSTLNTIYFAYFLTKMEYDIMFWGNLIVSKKVFLQHRRISRIITLSSSRTSCKSYFRDKNY